MSATNWTDGLVQGVMRIRSGRLWLVLLAAASGALASPASLAEELQVPNLKPVAAFDLFVDAPDTEEQGERALRFAFGAMNIGDHALDLTGLPPQGIDRTTAQQCVRWASRLCLERRAVGDFAWHPDHGHWHFEGFARYELRRIVDGTPDMSPEGLVAGGQKVSFCLMDTEAADEGGRPFEENPYFYKQCLGVIQGISPGWKDEYGAGLPGQQIVIDDVPDGVYALVLTLDPEGRLYQDRRDDDVAVSFIELLQNGEEVIQR